MIKVSKEYPEVTLEHMYVDNAAMQLVKAPKKIDVMGSPAIFSATSFLMKPLCLPVPSVCWLLPL